jgi:hypothetical protein
MSHAHKTVLQLRKMLKNLDRWLTKAEEHAQANSHLCPCMFVHRVHAQ